MSRIFINSHNLTIWICKFIEKFEKGAHSWESCVILLIYLHNWLISVFKSDWAEIVSRNNAVANMTLVALFEAICRSFLLMFVMNYIWLANVIIINAFLRSLKEMLKCWNVMVTVSTMCHCTVTGRSFIFTPGNYTCVTIIIPLITRTMILNILTKCT